MTVFSGADGAVLATLDGEGQGESFGSAVDATLDGQNALLVVGLMRRLRVPGVQPPRPVRA